MLDISCAEYLNTRADDAVINDLEKYLDIAFDPGHNVRINIYGRSELTVFFTNLLESVYYFKQTSETLDYLEAEVCRLRFGHGLTYKQIGKEIKKTRGTARRLTRRALQKLVDKLRKDAKTERGMLK